MKLLLVEDEARIASFVQRGLGAAGFAVEWVTTGAEALDRAQAPDATRPDLVVLDLGLPDIDGLDVLATLRTGGCAIPVLILTARTDAADRARAAELGVERYLTKPFSMAELITSLAAADPPHRGDPSQDRPLKGLGFTEQHDATKSPAVSTGAGGHLGCGGPAVRLAAVDDGAGARSAVDASISPPAPSLAPAHEGGP